MIYLTYNQQGLQDGLGAQLQRVLSIYLICHQYNFGYIHTPIVTHQHGITSEVLQQFNQMICLPSASTHPVGKIRYMSSCQPKVIEHMDQDQLIKITFAHQYIDSHPELLLQPFPYQFSWIDQQIGHPVKIAVHIRRGDVTKNQNQERFVSVEYYLECLEQLTTMLTQAKVDHTINIYSQQALQSELPRGDLLPPDEGDVREMEAQGGYGGRNSPQLYLDQDINQTFQALVNADILFTGFSSLSYSAAMLRRKGCVLYTPFWHQYAPSAIRLEQASDVLVNRSRILGSLGLEVC